MSSIPSAASGATSEGRESQKRARERPPAVDGDVTPSPAAKRKGRADGSSPNSAMPVDDTVQALFTGPDEASSSAPPPRPVPAEVATLRTELAGLSTTQEAQKQQLRALEAKMDNSDKKLERLIAAQTARKSSAWHTRGEVDVAAQKALKGHIRKAAKGSKLFAISLQDDGFYKYGPVLVLEDSTKDSFLFTTRLDFKGADEELTDDDMGSSPFAFTFRQEADAQRVIVVLNDILREQDKL